MKNTKTYERILLPVLVLAISFCWITAAWSHGDKIQIIPETLSARSGGTLQVKVNGLVNTKTATFSLTGLSGKYDLGEFSISSDDFTQTLQIPSDLPAGSYRLTVEGGGNSAKTVITIN
jgi:hypothetical protein